MGQSETDLINILEAHKGILFKISNAYSKDVEDRKDLEQEIVVQIWKSLGKFKGHSKISTWIYRIALNVSIAYNRKENNRSRINNSLEPSIIETVHSAAAPLRSVRSVTLHNFISQLDKYNKAILLLYLDDYSYEEISEIIGITKSNVGVKINRIKQQLKKKFTEHKIN